jgi:F0F1-type ATP synthase membrane subunit b/b'
MADSREQGRRAAQKAQADYERNVTKARDSRRRGFERAQKAGLSLREIGEAVALHWTTVQRVLKGK